jgi:hypothetical protein
LYPNNDEKTAGKTPARQVQFYFSASLRGAKLCGCFFSASFGCDKGYANG